MTRLQKDAIFKTKFLNMAFEQKGFNSGPWIGEKQVSPRYSLRKQIRWQGQLLAKDIDWTSARKIIFWSLVKMRLSQRRIWWRGIKKAWEQSRCKVEEFAANCKSELVQDGDIAKAAGAVLCWCLYTKSFPAPPFHIIGKSCPSIFNTWVLLSIRNSLEKYLRSQKQWFFLAAGDNVDPASPAIKIFDFWWWWCSVFGSSSAPILTWRFLSWCSNTSLLVQSARNPASWCTTAVTTGAQNPAHQSNLLHQPASPPHVERNQLKIWFWWRAPLR